MKKLIYLLIGLTIFSTELYGQKSRNFRGNSRKDFFGGAQDYRDITKNALQISFGPNYTLTRLRNTEYTTTDATGRKIESTIDPMGRIGGFIDIGMAHYRMKPSRFWSGLAKKNEDGFFARRVKSNLFHRYDWGIGFDYIGGKEKTSTRLFDALGNPTTTELTEGKFYIGYLTGRFTADRFTKLADSWHLETGLGVNFQYAILPGSQGGYGSTTIVEQKYQKNFMAQIHAHVGMQYRIRRGDYFVFGFYLPALGVYEMNKLKPTIQYFSSNYYPLHLQLKWVHHFTKKSNGCNTGSDEDRKRDENFRNGQ